MRARDPLRSIIVGLALGLSGLIVPAVFARGQAGSAAPWMNPALSAERRDDLLIHAMTLKDKVGLMHGVGRKQHPFKGYVGYVPANARLYIPALKLADG